MIDNLPWFIAVPVAVLLWSAYVIRVLADMRRDRNRRG